jgi:YidC/Oxa1 family membrane protein insertase
LCAFTAAEFPRFSRRLADSIPHAVRTRWKPLRNTARRVVRGLVSSGLPGATRFHAGALTPYREWCPIIREEELNLQNLFVVLSQQVEPSPGFIVGPIAWLFGLIINFLYNILFAMFGTPAHLLGLSIVIMTIIFRALMLPLTLKSQRSMMKMREIQPELKKIQDKYGNTKDPELMKKMNAERSALLAKHGANPLSGCLPMLIQMPLFFGLNFIMRTAFMYIGRLRDMYYELATALQAIPGWLAGAGETSPLMSIATEHIPANMLQNNSQWFAYIQAGMTNEAARNAVGGDVIHLGFAEDLSRVINRFTTETWERLLSYIQGTEAYYEIWTMVDNLYGAESFIGFNLVDVGGLTWPYILVPILIATTMFGSSWLMQLRNHDPNADDRQKTMQKVMLFGLPIMMAVFTIGFPTGVALFWITSQLFQLGTDIVLLKKANIPIRLPFGKAPESQVVDNK